MASNSHSNSLADFLVHWSQEHNIGKEALSALLVFLNNTSFPGIPRDAQSLLRSHHGDNNADDASSDYAGDHHHDVHMDETDGGFCDDDDGTYEMSEPVLSVDLQRVKVEIEDPLRVSAAQAIVIAPKRVDRYAGRIRNLRRLHHLDMYKFKKEMANQHNQMMHLCAVYEVENTKRFESLLILFEKLQVHCAAAAAESRKGLQVTSNLHLTVLSIMNYGCAIVEQPDIQTPTWPLTTSAQVLEFNSNLKEPAFRDQVLHRMLQWRCVITGHLRKTIAEYMKRMIHFKALIEFSWSGKTSNDDRSYTQKIRFEDSAEIISLIVDLLPGSLRSDVLKELKYYMKRCPQYYNTLMKKQTNKVTDGADEDV